MRTQTAALVGISHGTSSKRGQAVVRQLIDDVAHRLHAPASPGTAPASPPSVRLGHVDVQQPDVDATLASLPAGMGATIVPLLLSTGFHVNVDLREAMQDLDRPATLCRALGPDDRLTELLAHRLGEVGADPDRDIIILGAAGSSDTSAVRDCGTAAAMLAHHLGVTVHESYLSFAQPSVTAAVARARAEHPGRRVVVASYLLAPGYFQTLLESAGADLTTEPLLAPGRPTAPAQLVDLVLERYSQAVPVPASASVPASVAELQGTP
ncbi:sirohydrochlorin chelatase [Nesterenkonia sandarakina]|uniref:sirohydrochlorin chelatase n=1 Tax=Nesterenkonia sandarakina TaxID=272918 RepID=UPI000D04C0D6|nr:CbiX/SirB N-terminal domain-containing protein [Nesterenkonia sandarakina]